MTIPNVTITWCRRKAKCRWCEQPIEIATPMVRVFFWNKGNIESRKWNSQNCYHPECWIKQGLEYLEKNPFVYHKTDNTRQTKVNNSPLSEEDKRNRYLLVRRFNELAQRKNNIKTPYPDCLPIEANIIKNMTNIMMEVAVLGGVPKSWAAKITQ